jgi:uncharacterized protein (DUF1330 family)
MSDITPNRDAFMRLAQADDSAPVVMLNLLKFKERSDDGERTGQEEYGAYARDVTKMVAERGGRLVWSGRPEQVLIGDESQEWDMVALVEYPSRKAFIDMVSSPSYMESHKHREGGLERTVLIAMREVTR